MATNIFTQIEMPDGSIYDLAGGTSVEANPSEISTDKLSSIKIGEIVYGIDSNGSSGDVIIDKLWEGLSNTKGEIITLNNNISNYDMLYFNMDIYNNNSNFSNLILTSILKETKEPEEKKIIFSRTDNSGNILHNSFTSIKYIDETNIKVVDSNSTGDSWEHNLISIYGIKMGFLLEEQEVFSLIAKTSSQNATYYYNKNIFYIGIIFSNRLEDLIAINLETKEVYQASIELFNKAAILLGISTTTGSRENYTYTKISDTEYQSYWQNDGGYTTVKITINETNKAINVNSGYHTVGTAFFANEKQRIKILPNPSDLSEDATELTGLRVNGEDYKITNNTNIIPNPSENSSETLSKIAINNIVYDIAGNTSNSSKQINNDIRIDENINSISIDESGNLKITYTKNGVVYTNTYNKDTSETS